VAAQAYNNLGIPNPKADELPKIMNQGLQRIYGFQHDAGSWGWFYDDDGGLYMTSYVLFGLVMAEKSGFTVDEGVLSRGFGYLDKVLSDSEDAEIMAYALYVKSVAGRGDLEAVQKLASRSRELEPFGLSVLAMALQQEGDAAGAQALIVELQAQVTEDGNFASWPLDDTGEWGYRHWTMMSSAEKNTAAAIQALVALDPDSPLLTKAIRWLLGQRRGAGWRNTQATAFAVLGLSDYIQVTDELQSDYTYSVLLNGEEVAQGAVTPADVTDPIEPIQIPGSLLEIGENTVAIQRVGDTGQLYYTMVVRQALFYDGFTEVSSVDRGLALRRSYSLVEGSANGRNSNVYNVGDVVEVQLSLTVNEEMEHLLIEDSLPAGFEALNERLNQASGNGYGFIPFWEIWGYNYKSIYDSKVAFFVTRVSPGEHIYTYLMRATTPGEFSALPAEAYPMYVDEKWGRSGSARVIIEPESLTPRPELVADFDRDCLVTEFDTRQVAGAWDTENEARDVVSSDGSIVDLQDVAATVARAGMDCMDPESATVPGTIDEDAGFSVVLHETAPEVIAAFTALSAVDTLSVDLRLDEGGNFVDGFSLGMTFDPNQLQLIDVQLTGTAEEILALGPRVDNSAGTVDFGAVDIADEGGLQAAMVEQSRGHILATMLFQRTGDTEGDLTLQIDDVQATDAMGNMLNSEADVTTLSAGDVNCTGIRDSIDALFIMQYDVAILGDGESCVLNENEIFANACDTNNDGLCTVVDALLVLRCEVGFPNVLCPE